MAFVDLKWNNTTYQLYRLEKNRNLMVAQGATLILTEDQFGRHTLGFELDHQQIVDAHNILDAALAGTIQVPKI